jgi:hypothetical protein
MSDARLAGFDFFPKAYRGAELVGESAKGFGNRNQ